MRLILFPAVIMVLSLFGCDNDDSTLFKKLSSDQTGIHFNNFITENESVNILSYYYCYNGGGVGVADFNNDGLQDVFFTGNMVSSKLYLNKGNMAFEDITEKAGVATKDWIMGVSVVDINHDGFMDIYLNAAGPGLAAKHHNLLLINQKNLTFREEAAAYGLNDSSYCVQSAFLDYDRDGDLDMYLLTNDVDNVEKTFIQPATYPITRGRTVDKLYENVGDTLGHPLYRNVSASAGIMQEGYGLGLAVGDLNGDGWPDIYAANDFMPNDQLLINQRNKTFREAARESMPHQTYNGMGVDIEDINNDAQPDIMVMDMLPETNERRKTMIAKADYEKHFMRQRAGYVDEFMRNTVQLNQGTDPEGTTHFSDIAQLTGMHATDWSWGVLLADYDNDGRRDAYITNGFVKNITDLDFLAYNTDANMFGTDAVRANRTKDLLGVLKGVKLSNYMFQNGGNLAFTNVTGNWGLEHDSYSNGAAYADLDNDGDLDLVVNNINEEAFVFENTSNAAQKRNNQLQITLKGSDRNPNGIGSAITAYCGKDRIYSYFSPVKGYLSSMSGPLHFGLGQCVTIDSLAVTWPDGKVQLLKSVKANQKLVLDYAHAKTGAQASPQPAPAIFQPANATYNVSWKHSENDFNDFIDEPLLLNMYSRKGPGIAVGDADGRNGADFFLGGAAGLPGTLFTQTAKGTFEPQSINAEDARFEDTGALFFDADGDGDQDLYVVSGGSDFRSDTTGYADRLYFNDGKGHFKKQADALPLTTSSGSCVIAADFDRDGDLDIFRAGAVVPGNFSASPRSYLLRNDGGRFKDVTKEIAPELGFTGMINAAVWSDFDNDGWPDLILTGEWMQPVFLQNKNGKLAASTNTGLQNMTGWWSSIYPADLDHDGDTDYILGNMGDNVDYRPTKEHPLELYHGDFAGNGRQKPLATQYVLDESGKKKPYPMAYRDDLFRSMPVLKKRFNTYEPFSRAKLGDIFESKLISSATHFRTETFRSCILENKGNGRFAVRELPVEAQFSCVYGVIVTDADGDGHSDILLTGNSFSNEVVFGSMDASLGVLLKGDGKLNFNALPANRSGLFLTGATRGLGAIYDTQNRPVIIAPTNSGDLKMLSLQQQPARIIRALPHETYAEITFKNGKTSRKEFYYGAGYLSQQENAVELNDGIREVKLFDIHQKSTRLVPGNAARLTLKVN